MLVEGQNSNPGSGAEGAGSSTATAEAGQPPAAGSQATPDSGSQAAGGQAQVDTAPAERTLDELQTGEAGKLSPAESKKIRLAARMGFKTQAQIDEYLGSKAAPAATVPGEPGEKPAATPPKVEATKPDALVNLMKAISPNLDPSKPEAAIDSVKELQRTYTEASTRVKQLESYYPQLEAGLIEQLDKGQAGILEIYKRMGRQVPAGLFTGSAPAAPVAAAPAAAAATIAELDGLLNDDFVPAATLKAYIPKLAAQLKAEIRAELDKEYAPLKDSHGRIMAEVSKNAASEEAVRIRDGAMADAQFHSDFMGSMDPEEALVAPAVDIWKASVDEAGKFKSDPHPEFAKLKKILQARKAEYLDSGHKAASYEHFLYEKLHKSGNLAKYMAGQAEREKSKLLAKQQQRVQPALVPKGAGAGGLASFVVPQSEADVAKMTPAQVAELKRKVMSGQLKIAVPTT